MSERSPVLVIAGPTASGKSRAALALAGEFAGTIINADSMQMYRELGVLSARPSAADMGRAPHRLFGTLPASQPCSAGLWRDLALTEIKFAASTHRLPIVVGGTGLYLKSLIEGIAAVPAIHTVVRAEARARLARLGAPQFHAELADRDPAMAATLTPADTQRLVRAREVIESTGRSLLEWQRGGRR